jgi:hypothetical protein
MAILSEDTKLLKSAVMADTSDGGGAMTGNVVVDGQSNNLFPDISVVDTAFGRTRIRKIFGVVHTDNVDMALGMHAMITDAPNDELVQCALIPSPSWGAVRDDYRAAIEKYLTKGPLADCYVYEQHFAGSLVLRLFAQGAAELPKGGETIVIRSKTGLEQYVRVLATTTSSVVYPPAKPVTVALCEIGTALAFDFEGASPAEEQLPKHSTTTAIYTAAPSPGSKFYGIKPMALAGAPGDTEVQLTGGLYTPIVPSTTAETAIVDDYPLQRRASISRTARGTVTLPSVNLASVVAGTSINTPTPMEPGSVNLVSGAQTYTDNGSGGLLLLGNVVGTADYRSKTITFSGPQSAGGYTLTYKPATVASGGTHSALQTITTANQGLVFTNAFEPPPAPGTFTLSYMVQGNWYDLKDNGAGKMVGADTTHGIGTVSYSTGSVAATLGAIPDVGSAIVYQWGDAASAKDFTGAAPTKLQADFVVNDLVDAASLTLSWPRGGSTYAATCSAAGVLQGGATGTVQVVPAPLPVGAVGYTPPTTRITFMPNTLPSGDVTVSWTPKAGASDAPAPQGLNGVYTLPAPIALGSVACKVDVEPYVGVLKYDMPTVLELLDDYNGHVRAVINNTAVTCGTINYTTGVVTVSQTINAPLYEVLPYNPLSGASGLYQSGFSKREFRPSVAITLKNGQITSFASRAAAGTPAGTPSVAVVTPSFYLQIPVEQGSLMHTDGLAAVIGGELYTSRNSVVQRGWDAATGVATITNAGSATLTGKVLFTVLPTNGTNSVDLRNASIDTASGLVVTGGAFRTSAAPLKTGVFQIQNGAVIGNGNGAGAISGGGWYGMVDYGRGIVQWSRVPPATVISDYAALEALSPLAAEQLSYNAVYLKYLPIDSALLGIDTTRLPLDGKVPIYRAGDLVTVHNTQPVQLPNPLVKGTVYPFGRTRVANVRIKTATGVTVPSSLYATDMNVGNATVPPASDITGYPQPWTVEHRVEDVAVVRSADISGKLDLTSQLTHTYPANTSYVSSCLVAGDVFGRVTNVFDQATWTGDWSGSRIGSDTLASYNTIDNPITTTNRGCVTERWALIFTSTSAFRIVGEKYGQIGTGDINTLAAPNNTAVAAPFFSIVPQGWGAGWSAGNVLRLDTYACGMAFGVVQTILQGTPTLESDVFTVALRLDVDR